MENTDDEERANRRKIRRNEYYKLQRQQDPERFHKYDKNKKRSPEYKEKELLRLKKRYLILKDYNIFRKAIPHFLTV